MDVMANYRTHIGNRTPKFEGSHTRRYKMRRYQPTWYQPNGEKFKYIGHRLLNNLFTFQ